MSVEWWGRKEGWVYAGLAALTLVVFFQGLWFPFTQYDDNIYVTHNYLVRQGITAESIAEVFRAPIQGLYHPLTFLSHMADVKVFGMNAAGHHYVSLALHVANVLLLYYFLRRATGSSARSAFVAAVFSIHPLHVEPVIWIASRKDVLSTLFWFTCIVFYARHRERPRSATYVAVLVAALLALLSKPMAITLPVTLLLLDYWLLSRPDEGRRKWLRAIRDLWPLFLLSAAGAAMALYAAGQGGSLRTASEIGVAERFLNPPVYYLQYLRQTVWPAGLSANHPLPPQPYPLWMAGGASALLLAVTVAVLLLRRRAPYLLVGWLWFVLTLLPVAGFVPVGDHSLADRYMYVPLVGLAIVAAWGVPDLLGNRPRLAAALGAAAILALTPAAWLQTRHWQTPIRVFERMLEVHPDNIAGLQGLGNLLVQRGEFERAFPLLNEALRLAPDRPEPHVTLSSAFARLGRFDEAARHAEAALTLEPADAVAHNNLAVALMQLGRLDEAIAHGEAAVDSDPRYPDALQTLGNALLAKGDSAAAVARYEQALRLEPDRPDLLANLGAALLIRGDYAQAEVVLRQAVSAAPDDPVSRTNLAVALDGLGRTDEARREAEAALECLPTYEKARQFLDHFDARATP